MTNEEKMTAIQTLTNYFNSYKEMSSNEAAMNIVLDTWDKLAASFSEKKELTDKTMEVLNYMKSSTQFSPRFTAADVAAATGRTPRSISGAFRSLVNQGYIEKVADKPAAYVVIESKE